MRERGFTLIEIIISLSILAVGLVGILSLFPIGFDSARRSVNNTQSAIYAQETLEKIRCNNFPATSSTSGFPPIINTSGVFADPGYSWALTVSTAQTIQTISTSGVTSADSSRLRKVDLTVSWQYRNKTNQQTFTTYVAK